jgi:hypothetical protein
MRKSAAAVPLRHGGHGADRDRQVNGDGTGFRQRRAEAWPHLHRRGGHATPVVASWIGRDGVARNEFPLENLPEARYGGLRAGKAQHDSIPDVLHQLVVRPHAGVGPGVDARSD